MEEVGWGYGWGYWAGVFLRFITPLLTPPSALLSRAYGELLRWEIKVSLLAYVYSPSPHHSPYSFRASPSRLPPLTPSHPSLAPHLRPPRSLLPYFPSPSSPSSGRSRWWRCQSRPPVLCYPLPRLPAASRLSSLPHIAIQILMVILCSNVSHIVFAYFIACIMSSLVLLSQIKRE